MNPGTRILTLAGCIQQLKRTAGEERTPSGASPENEEVNQMTEEDSTGLIPQGPGHVCEQLRQGYCPSVRDCPLGVTQRLGGPGLNMDIALALWASRYHQANN